MKRNLILACMASLLFVGCEKEVPITSLEIQTSSNEIFYDSKVPVLKLVMVPDNATDTEISWTSSDPSYIEVDAAGVLKIVKFEYDKEIVITAQNPSTGIQAVVALKMLLKKANIEDYGIVEIKGYKFSDPYNHSKQLEIKFDILDRNLGATKIYDPKASDEANKAAIGDYYQFGNSIPVATVEGVNSCFNKEHQGQVDDWTLPEKTPCPLGWRMATKAELSLLASAMEVADPYYGDQSAAEIAAAEKFEALLGLPKAGQWVIKGKTVEERNGNQPELYLPAAKYFWGNELAAGDKELSDRGFRMAASFEYNSFPLGTFMAEVNTARPIRCVRD